MAPGAGAGAAGRDQFLRGGVPARIGCVRAARYRTVKAVVEGGTDATTFVRVIAVETILPLGQRGGVAKGIVGRGGKARFGRECCRIQLSGNLAGNDRHGCMFMARNDRFHANEQWQIFVGIQVLNQRILELLNRLPAPHVLVGTATRNVSRRGNAAVNPGGRRALTADERVDGRAEGLVFHQCAVAVTVAAVPGLYEPVQAKVPVGLVSRLLHQLLHRDRAIRAGGVVVEVAGHIFSRRLGGSRCNRRRGGQGDGTDGRDHREGDPVLAKFDFHSNCSSSKG